jgi:hypothetical protein
MQVPVPSLVTVTTVFGLTKFDATVQIEVVVDVTVTDPPAVEVTFKLKLPLAPIWSLIVGKLITFASPTTIVGSMYIFEPRA